MTENVEEELMEFSDWKSVKIDLLEPSTFIYKDINLKLEGNLE